MATSTPGLIAVLVGSVALLVVLINSRLRLHPFIALLVVAIGAGLVAGEPVATIAKSVETGAGGILGNVGITLALGAMLGRLLADSSATDVIAGAVVRRSTPRTLPWLMTAAAFVIGIPMFFEVGLILLLPLVFSVAERMRQLGHTRHSPYTMLVIPTIAALATLHGMVPPHPGPLTAVAGLHADLGKTIVLGLVCAVPTVILAGPVFATWMAPRIDVRPEPAMVEQFVRQRAENGRPTPTGGGAPSGDGPGAERRPVPVGWAVTCILIPVALMLVRTIAEIALPEGSQLLHMALLVGEPTIAMLIGFLVALLALALLRGRPGETVRWSITESVKAVVGILLIIGAGGSFNQVLEDSGISHAIASAAGGAQVNVIVLAWLLALLLSASTGSATVGIVSSTGIVAPLVTAAGTWHTSLVVLAIGAGSIGLNYVNHAGFWLVKESFGMSMGQATKIHTTTQTLVSLLGLGMTLLLSVFL
ncbi:GntP family permease [Streptomyces pinistramenti]|uniref:GntP family permease n=1 Tax=Streptomyces pinistramenti TaxID=2884812 RepID=UPI001D085520|nr:gluconate:H+ symporter [Streptomyces pinistramenti]MCB5910034.1 GntP family permease [Streptomyces pinistramenti]